MALRPSHVLRLLEHMRDLHGKDEQPSALSELTDEVNSFLFELAGRVRDMQTLVSSSREDSDFSALSLLVQGLAEELSVTGGPDNKWTSREGDVLVSWPELHEMLQTGANARRVPEWALEAFAQMTGVVRNREFPCIFGRSAVMMKSGWACFVDDVTNEAGRDAVRKAILSYFGVIKRFPKQKAVLMPLTVIVKPVPGLRAADYGAQAWGLLQYLHDNDKSEWPQEVPLDPETGNWSFCFSGRQLFVNVSHPAHEVHRSRNLGDSMTFVMQPRSNFDVVAGNHPKGHKIRNKIRRRAETYDNRPPSTDLNFFGSEDNREWKQMLYNDGDDNYPKTCPLKIHRNTKESKD